MRNIITIAGREIKSSFSSPVAYVLMSLFGLLFGYVFYSATAYFVMQGMRQQMMGGAQPMSVNDFVIVPAIGNANVFMLFLMPLISMRMYAEEKRSGTIELLLTSPIHDWEIVLGKWLGAMFLYVCMLLVAAVNIVLLFVWGSPDWRTILTSLLGLLLQGGFFLALGGFISTLTRNQIIAATGTFAVNLLLFILSWVSSYNEAGWAQVIAYCSVMTHFEPFSKGILDTKDMVFYVSATFLGLFLTVRSLESLRWRA